MRHRKAGLKLNRTPSHRDAMFRNMVTSLFKHDRIRTTDVKAKAIRRWADHLITLAKRGDLHARRQALSIVREKDVVHKLFEQAGDRFGTTSGGYTRIVKLGNRPGDAALMSLIELVALQDTKTKKSKKKKAKVAGKQKRPTPDKKVQAGVKSKIAEEKKEPAVKTDSEPADVKGVSAEDVQPDAAAKTSPEPQPEETTGQKPSEPDAPAEKPDKDDK